MRAGPASYALAATVVALLLAGWWLTTLASHVGKPLSGKGERISPSSAEGGPAIAESMPERRRIPLHGPEAEEADDTDVEASGPSLVGLSESEERYLKKVRAYMEAHDVEPEWPPWIDSRDIALLRSWIDGYRDYRSDLVAKLQQIANEAVMEKIEEGDYEVLEPGDGVSFAEARQPTAPGQYVSWGHFTDEHGEKRRRITRVDKNRYPEWGGLDALIDRLDREIAAQAAAFFTTLSRVRR